MEYEVKVTHHAIAQMQEAAGYISRVLLAPETARRWMAKLQREIAGLRRMPLRFPQVAEEPWRTQGIRKLAVENFLVYYWTDEARGIVWVTAVVYGRRDQCSALREMPQESTEE